MAVFVRRICSLKQANALLNRCNKTAVPKNCRISRRNQGGVIECLGVESTRNSHLWAVERTPTCVVAIVKGLLIFVYRIAYNHGRSHILGRNLKVARTYQCCKVVSLAYKCYYNRRKLVSLVQVVSHCFSTKTRHFSLNVGGQCPP